jgi:hypothetical protein
LPRLSVDRGALHSSQEPRIRLSGAPNCRSSTVVVRTGPGLSKITRPYRGMSWFARIGRRSELAASEPGTGIRLSAAPNCRSSTVVVRTGPGLSKIFQLAHGMDRFARIARRGLHPSQEPGLAHLARPTADRGRFWLGPDPDSPRFPSRLTVRASCQDWALIGVGCARAKNRRFPYLARPAADRRRLWLGPDPAHKISQPGRGTSEVCQDWAPTGMGCARAENRGFACLARPTADRRRLW